MEKKHIIRFLKDGRRGAYTWLVEIYAHWVTSMSVTAAMELIKEDLANESGTTVELHYFSLARAVARFKKKTGVNSKAGVNKKLEFKDTYEISERQSGPGKFKVEQPKVKVGQ
jgi:hypothetical protein